LDCLVYGFSKLVEEFEEQEDIQLSESTINLLQDLDARLTQVASSSKHWISCEEWESVYILTCQIIEMLKLNNVVSEGDKQHSNE
jgi:hypothetical protein